MILQELKVLFMMIVGMNSSKLKHGGFFDAATRVGWAIGRALPFVKVGWGLHRYTLHYDFPGNTPNQNV